MIKIRSIVIYGDSDEKMIVQYPDDLRFETLEGIEKYKSYLTVKWSKVFEKDVTVIVSYVEIPRNVNVLNICNGVSREMKIPLRTLFSKAKGRDITLAKMFAVNICLDANIPVAHIEDQTPFKNRIYYYYRNTLEAMRETDPKIDERYKKVSDTVMENLKQ